ncbi:hypothetical protein E2320_006609 [Naja naja]|nr:hypothetical protein E2320_006609 [Naja naja]
MDWRKWKQEKKEEKKKWKETKLLKKLEKERARVQMEKEREETKSTEEKGHYTVSVAVPGSILSNAQSPELRTYLAGQIARACVIFCVDEIVVFDEQGETSKTIEGEFEGIRGKGQACVQLARILQYLECPQALEPTGQSTPCPNGRRVGISGRESKTQKGVVVSSHNPRTVSGFYWGYSVRLASCLSAVFAESPFKDGYDLSIGTSERGSSGLETGVDADPNLDVSDPGTLFDLYLNTCPGKEAAPSGRRKLSWSLSRR